MIIIYHKDCSDGFCAAYLMYLCYGPPCSDVSYIAAQYGDSPPDKSIYLNNEVYIVDFSYPEDVLLEMSLYAERLVVLDHHKTASHVGKLIAENLIEGTFDESMSGAKLTLDYLFGHCGFSFDSHTYDLVDYVQDRDLWAWKLPDSKDINAYIRSFGYTFDEWNSFPDTNDMVVPGRAINRYRDRLISEHVTKATMKSLPYSGAVEVPHIETTVIELISDIGSLASVRQPYAVVTINKPEGVAYSLRSQPDGMDVSAIAKTFGGGGHKHAAGFLVPYSDNKDEL